MWIEDWTPKAVCRSAQPDELFVRGAEQNKAKQMCTGCPVRTECLAEALDNQIEWGVWGGMTERQEAFGRRRRSARSSRRPARRPPRPWSTPDHTRPVLTGELHSRQDVELAAG